jgi:hypothetical protein
MPLPFFVHARAQASLGANLRNSVHIFSPAFDWLVRASAHDASSTARKQSAGARILEGGPQPNQDATSIAQATCCEHSPGGHTEPHDTGHTRSAPEVHR